MKWTEQWYLTTNLTNTDKLNLVCMLQRHIGNPDSSTGMMSSDNYSWNQWELCCRPPNGYVRGDTMESLVLSCHQ